MLAALRNMVGVGEVEEMAPITPERLLNVAARLEPTNSILENAVRRMVDDARQRDVSGVALAKMIDAYMATTVQMVLDRDLTVEQGQDLTDLMSKVVEEMVSPQASSCRHDDGTANGDIPPCP